MKGSEEYLYSFMKGRRKCFIIPVYQRNYNWKNNDVGIYAHELEKDLDKNKNVSNIIRYNGETNNSFAYQKKFQNLLWIRLTKC